MRRLTGTVSQDTDGNQLIRRSAKFESAKIESAPMSERMHVRCRWLVTPDQPPRENMCVRIEDGRVVDLSTQSASATIDLGNAILLPGLVNAHTHLEFSRCREPLQPALPFPAWIRAVIHNRHQQSGGQDSAIVEGCRESLAAGVVAVGEIATSEASARVLPESGLGGVVFREMIGLSEAARHGQLAILRDHLRTSSAGGRCRMGISPHAPYSVHPDLFDDLVRLAGESGASVAMHLAETEDELQLLKNGTGRFRHLLEELGVWNRDAFSASRSIDDFLEPLSRLRRVLVVHGNYLSPGAIRFLAEHDNMTLVVCPRTHAFFRHPPHPWPRLLQLGGKVALGTDSRASNPDLSLWSEVRLLHRQYPQTDPNELLKMATVNGASALGLDTGAGRIIAGGPAEFLVAHVGQDFTDPWQALLSQPIRFESWDPAGGKPL